MEVHIGREAVTSWKDFIVRYLLIVLGILSAWAVNQWNDSRQHARLADQARIALREELGANLKELREVIASNERDRSQGPTLASKLLAALQAGRGNAEIARDVIGDWQPAMTLQLPTLRRDAWEAAIASHALTYLGGEELRRYSAAYAAMHDLDQFSAYQLSSQTGELLRGITAWQLKRRLGQVDAMEITRLLLLWETLRAVSMLQLRALDAPLAAAVGAPASVAAAVSAASH